LSQVRLTFDVFYSRLEAIESGRLATVLRQLPAFATELTSLRSIVDESVVYIDQSDAELRASLIELAQLSDVALQNLRLMNLTTMDNWAKMTTEERNRLAFVVFLLALLLITVLILLVVAVITSSRALRVASNRQVELVQINKRASLSETSLMKSEARLREAQKMAKIGNWEVDDKDVLDVSAEVFEIFQVDADKFDGSMDTFLARCTPLEAARVSQAARQAWKEAKSYQEEFSIDLPSGEQRRILSRAEPTVDANGATRRLVGTIQDITERAQAEDRLRQAQKMEAVGQLTGGVAHDFNNLLTVVMGNMELLRETTVSGEQRELIEASVKAALRGSKLTQSMLSFARKARLTPVRLDLNKLVRDMEAWSLNTLPATIQVKTQLQDPVHPVLVDENQATTALLNIILNAKDAMPGGGHLKLETQNVILCPTKAAYVGVSGLSAGRYVKATIEDTGCGIPSNKENAVFEPFFTTKPPGSGTGLGLSMVMGFMEQSGGAVSITSHEGEGTKVELYFKAMETADILLHPDEDVGTNEHGPLRILVVEDEPEVLSVVERNLRHAGHEVATALSGQTAIQLFDTDRSFDLVVTDAVMPGAIQGTDFAAHCRRKSPGIPIIFISGYSDFEAPQDMRRTVWLVKPVKRTKLLNTIDTLIGS
ncbi:MAG: ATP-binding protein, partial [Pseudomonadota bacterium]